MNPGQGAGPHRRAADALQRATGALSTAAMARMEQDMPWFRELSAQDRSWVGMIVQAGIRGFVDWYRQAVDQPAPGSNEMVASVFGAAPRALAGVINLQQTVGLVRLSIEVVESNVEQLLDPADAAEVRAAVLRYAREVAFATAEVYARAAEVRGAWDARLEALVVDAVLRSEADETLLSRASALGWAVRGDVAVVLGSVPDARSESDIFDEVRRMARAAGMDALCAVQGERLVVLLGGVSEPREAAEAVSDLFGDGPVSSVRSLPTWRRPISRPGRPSPPTGPRPAGPRPRDRCAAPTCSPSACSPATATPAGTWWTRCTCHWSRPAAP